MLAVRLACLVMGLGAAVVPSAHAAPPIPSLTPQDIGSPALPGESTAGAESVTITAAGKGIGLKADECHFFAAPFTNAFDIRVRVTGLDPTDIMAKAGLMVRQNTNADGLFAGVFTTPSGAGAQFQYRTGTGANAVQQGYFRANLPFAWLRLRRVDNQWTGFASYDGIHWTQLGTADFDPGPDAQFGFAVTSHRTDLATRATFAGYGDVTAPNDTQVFVDAEPLGPSSRRTPLVISEIMYHPKDRPDGRDLEFIELYNSQPYPEDISGHRLTGEISFTFPQGTSIPGGGFLVVVHSPKDFIDVYGPGRILGPYSGRLSNRNGSLRLVNEADAVLLEVEYDTTSEWTKAADGEGHSLVLARPSYSERSPHAWQASRVKGGSPGRPEAIELIQQLGLRINELVLPSATSQGFVELYNAGPNAVPLAGCTLRTTPASRTWTLPATDILQPGEFHTVTLTNGNRSLDSTGGTFFLENPDNDRVLDDFQWAGQPTGGSQGRWPNGSPQVRTLPAPTPGAPNARPSSPVVFNEIHFKPINTHPEDQFIELHNRTATPIQLSGWRVTGGIDYLMPPGTSIPAGGYLVIARDAARFREAHPGIPNTLVIGNFSGNLASRGERLVLQQPGLIPAGMPGAGGTWWIDVAEAQYRSGSRLGRWADAGGSTLELVDARSDPSQPSAWQASDESAKAPWTLVEFTGVLDNGAETPDSLQIILLGEGECLIDNVEVIGPGNTNRVANGTFEEHTTGWSFTGNHIRTSRETTEGFQSNGSLHLRASGNGDTGANKIRVRLTRSLNEGDVATLRARVRWLKGWPEILLRLKGNYLEAFGRLNLPPSSGTPGAPNSRRLANAAPLITDVRHFPITPTTTEPVVVSARVDDPDGLTSIRLNYRIDPETNWTSVVMVDSGRDGDATPLDGVFSARIPPPESGRLVAFTVEATDAASPSASAIFPPGAPAQECLVRFGEPTPGGAFGIYRLWVSQTGSRAWSGRPNLSNEPIDSTFAYGNHRVIYNAGGRFAGSPYHQQFGGPTSPAHYVIEFPEDERFLGASALNKIHAPGNGPFDDTTIQREQAIFWLARKMSLPWLHRRYVQMIVNGSKRTSLMEDTQVGSDDFIESWFPDDPDGSLFKLQPWFEFSDGTSPQLGFNNLSWWMLQDYSTTNGFRKLARYRWNWLPRGVDGTANNYSDVYRLIDTAVDFSPADYFRRVSEEVDLVRWMRGFAINHFAGNWDSIGYFNQQNTYGYKPTRGPWQLILWDENIVFGNSGSHGPSDLPLFSTSDPVIGQWFFLGPFRRLYFQALSDLIDGPLASPEFNQMLDAKYAAFLDNGVTASSPTAIKSFVNTARRDVRRQLTNELGTFNVTSGSAVLYEDSAEVILFGTAPLQVSALLLNGQAVTPEWISVADWQLRTVLPNVRESLRISGIDAAGQPVDNTSRTVTITAERASDILAFTEIMHRPVTPDAAYVELQNRSARNPINLSGWRVDGLDLVFPENTFLSAGAVLVLAKNPVVFNATYGPTISGMLEFRGTLPADGALLRLIRPGTAGRPDEVITSVRYSAAPPWPAIPSQGISLQLTSPFTSDDERPGNWSVVIPPPPETNRWRYAESRGTALGSNLLVYVTTDPPFLNRTSYVGSYRGSFDGQTDFAYLLKINREPDGTHSATLAFTGRGVPESDPIPLNRVTVTDTGLFRFRWDQVLADYSGRLSTTGDRITGTFTFNGGSAPIVFRRDTAGGTAVLDDIQLRAAATDSEPEGPNLVLNGDFEDPLDPVWIRGGGHLGSIPSRVEFHGGHASLEINAVRSGDTSTNNAVWQPITGLVPGREYVLSYWYLPSPSAGSVVVALDGGSPIVPRRVKPAPVLHLEYSPGRMNVLTSSHPPAPSLWLNEVVPGPGGWVEIVNTGSSDLSLDDCHLSDDVARAGRWRFPRDVRMGPGTYLTVGLDATPPKGTLKADFSLPAAAGELVLSEIREGETRVLDLLRYSNGGANSAFGPAVDGNPGTLTSLANATPGRPNDPRHVRLEVSADAQGWRFSWNSRRGLRYRILVSPALDSGTWNPAATATAQGDVTEYLLPESAAGARYVRVELLP